MDDRLQFTGLCIAEIKCYVLVDHVRTLWEHRLTLSSSEYKALVLTLVHLATYLQNVPFTWN